MEETNVQVVGKKLWKLIRAMCYMVRKGISKGKLMVNLITMLKRSKIAGKAALLNLMLHHHSTAASDHRYDEYEFSCGNSPTVSFPFRLGKRNKNHAGACDDEAEDDVETASAVKKVLEMPGLGVVRRPRMTEWPSPLPEVGGAAAGGHVDEAAEDFIVRFYNDLRKQNVKALR